MQENSQLFQDSNSEDIKHLVLNLSILPENWDTTPSCLDTICLVATLTDHGSAWNCVFQLSCKALKGQESWNFYYPFLFEIQRPVSVSVLKSFLLYPGKGKIPLSTPAKRALTSLLEGISDNKDNVFWPQFFIFLKEITKKRNRETPIRIRKLVLKHYPLLKWSSYTKIAETEKIFLKSEDRKPGEAKVWGSETKAKIEYLLRLIKYQANELRWIRELTASVSEKLNCPVLTMHNASLGATSGWGIPDFRDQINDTAIFHEFSYEAEKRKRHFLNVLPSTEDLRILRELWVSRIVKPKLGILCHYLGEAERLGTVDIGTTEKWLSRIEGLTGVENILESGGKYLAPLPIHAATIELFLEIHLKWAKRVLDGWLHWHALLLSLLSTGSKFIKTGKCKHLVIPWINKFFISSLRKRDIEYITTLTNFLGKLVPETRIVLVDDTTKKSDPSLKLAIPHINEKLSWFRICGLGIFGDGSFQENSKNQTEQLLSAFRDHQMVVIRPYHPVSNYKSLFKLLEEKDSSFLTPRCYDSSWKDNLDFLYWGTSVFPLTGAINFDPFFPPLALTGSMAIPFGVFYKKTLLRFTFGRNAFEKPSSLFRDYGLIANVLD